jgi:hypothetical protein
MTDHEDLIARLIAPIPIGADVIATIKALVAERQTTAHYLTSVGRQLEQAQAAIAALVAERDAAHALLREARAMVVRLGQALGDEGLIVDIPDPVPPLLARIEAHFADKEPTP